MKNLRDISTLLVIASLATAFGAGLNQAVQKQQPENGHRKFTLLIYENESELAKRTSGSEGPGYWSEYAEVAMKWGEAGVIESGSPLHWGSRIKTVTSGKEGFSIATGPLAHSKLHLGGYFTIKAKDLEAAIKYAQEIPAAKTGAIVVCPEFEAPAMGGMKN